MKTLKSLFRELAKKPRKRNLPFRVNYHGNWLVPPLAIFVGIYIVLYGHHRSFGEAILMPAFYMAAAPSVAAAWLMMGYIVKSTYRLDEQYPWAITWWRGPLPRLALQLWHGVLVPGFAVLIFYAFYFTVREQPLRFWRYVAEDFPFVLLMLAGFSILTWVYYRLRALEIMEKYRQWRRDHQKTEKEMEERWTEGDLDAVPSLEKAKEKIALLEPYSRENNRCMCTYLNGRADKEPYTMKDFYERHEGYHFHRPRPEIILNRAAIREMFKVGPDVYITLDKGRPGEEIIATVRKRDACWDWWNSSEDSMDSVPDNS